MQFLFWLLWDCGSPCFFCLPSGRCGYEACVSFLMGGTGGVKTSFLLWWAGLCLVKLELSADESGCAFSLLDVWPKATQPWGSLGSMVKLMATSKRAYAKRKLPGLLCQHPCPCSRTLPTHASTGDPQSQAGLAQSCRVSVPFSWVLVCTGFCLCSPRICFPQTCGSSVVKSRCPSKSDSLGLPVPLPDPQFGKSDVGPRTFAIV